MIRKRGNRFSRTNGFVCPKDLAKCWRTKSLSNSAQRLEVVIAGDEGSVRLDRVLAARLEELSRSRLKALILAGSVTVRNVRVRDPAHHVAKGDVITIDV